MFVAAQQYMVVVMELVVRDIEALQKKVEEEQAWALQEADMRPRIFPVYLFSQLWCQQLYQGNAVLDHRL